MRTAETRSPTMAAPTLLAVLLAAVVAFLAGALPAQAAERDDGRAAAEYSSNDFDGDGVRNRRDNCLLVPNRRQGDRDGDRVGTRCDGPRSSRTVKRLRFGYSQYQLDAIFSSLRAGPMPGWEREAHGYVSLLPDNDDADRELQKVFQLLWQGKVWYTRADGGYLFNRMFADIETHHHDVHYGKSAIDGRRSIVVEPGFPVDQFFDNIRMVQPEIYLGYSFSKEEYGVPLGEPMRQLNFVLDFQRPGIRTDECPQCLEILKDLGISIEWPLGPDNPAGIGRAAGQRQR